MKIVIGFSDSDELKAIVAFVTWQQCGRAPTVEIDAGVSLRAGRGAPSVVLFEDGEQLAVGFWEVVKYWQEAGQCLC